MRIAKKISLIVGLGLVGSTFAQTELDRSVPPKSAEAPKINIGKAQEKTLDNGLKVIVVENHKLPRISFQLSLDRPPIKEGNMAGMLGIYGQLMMAGTDNRSKDNINESIDFIGASLSASSTGMYGSSLSKHTPTLLEVFTDVLYHPTFPEEELKKEKTQAISGLETSKNDPNAISGNVSAVVNYGKNHPYGEIETEESINNITVDAIKEYYKRYFLPNIAYLVIVGDIVPDDAFALAEKHFGSWKKGEAQASSLKRIPPLQSSDVSFVNKDGAVQSVVSVTYPVYLKPGSKDQIAARVMNEILGGGGFSARLMQNLREDKAYTYGAYSRLRSDRHIGSFTASASVRNEVTDSALVQMLFEMQRMASEPVKQEKLDLVKNKLAGAFARSLERPQTVANFALNTSLYNLPSDYYQNYLSTLSKVTIEDVQRAAKKFVRPENAHIVVVGNREDVLEKLKPFSPTGEVMVYDVYGDLEKNLDPITDGTTAQDVFDKYLLAITGQSKLKKAKKQLNKIKSVNWVMEMEIPGAPMKMSMYTIKEAPGKFVRRVEAGGQVFQKSVLNNGVAKESGMMGSKDVEGDELKRLKEEAQIVPELHYAESGNTFKLLGIKDDLYKVEIISETGEKSYEFYNIETGLKMKTSSTFESEDGPMTVVSEIESYEEYDGLHFPKKMSQSMGPQSFKMTTSKVTLNEDIDDKEFE